MKRIEKLINAVKKLEDKSSSMLESIEELQQQLSEREEEARIISKRVALYKKTLVKFLAKENYALNEIRFLEEEKTKRAERYLELSRLRETNISLLGDKIKDIEFMKGEVEALMDKMSLLEVEVPLRFQDQDHLGEKLIRSLESLNDLYNKMQTVDKNFKRFYYKRSAYGS